MKTLEVHYPIIHFLLLLIIVLVLPYLYDITIAPRYLI